MKKKKSFLVVYGIVGETNKNYYTTAFDIKFKYNTAFEKYEELINQLLLLHNPYDNNDRYYKKLTNKFDIIIKTIIEL